MAKSKLKTREELTIEWLEKELKGVNSTEKAIETVEKIVDAIMRAREADMTGEFYIAVERELGNE